ncbi:MAG: hybrid sensor histidine kinase/response regulator [Verrucomicrobiota bacterium]|nr:hybrid sensor histidine kinase/response regulator [Verrucomicrobiota bacterium]
MQKILVIEDTPEVRNLITESLQINGFNTVSAEDGEEGVRMALAHLPDLILCDVQMPKRDGYQVLEAVRNDPTSKTIPFIFLTGVADKGHVRQGMNLGADDYLPKPFMIGELLAAVNTRLKRAADNNQARDKRMEELRESLSLALPHELMTPLNGILGFASVLMQDAQNLPPQEVLEFAQHIHTSASRLQRVIENFLLYSQIELVFTDPAKVEAYRNADPSAVKSVLTDLARKKADQAGRSNDLLLQLQEGEIRIAHPKLEKIFSEILDNAFKFSPQGSSVIVTSGGDEKWFRIQITDHGRGLTPDQITKMGAHMQFGRKTHEQQGSGLGFAIAKRLAELHGGTIIMQSVAGQRTTAEILFPVS